jgi:hypothetical protein
MLGANAAWVRNVRAAGGNAVLLHGQHEQVRLEEIALDRRAPVLKAYLQIGPGARPHLPIRTHRCPSRAGRGAVSCVSDSDIFALISLPQQTIGQSALRNHAARSPAIVSVSLSSPMTSQP